MNTPSQARPRVERKPVVLFVDDEPLVLAGLKDALRGKPLQVLTAASAAAGLDLLSHQPVDAVVSDEQMPGMKGAEFLAAVRRTWPHTLRVMLTGHASLDAAIAAINEGEVYRFLTKPCNPVDVYLTIQQGLQLRALAHQTSRLLARSRRQRQVLEDLEASHPGISQVVTDDRGAIVVEDPEIATLIAELEREP